MARPSNRPSFHSAFTLVELLIVLVVITILATLAVIGYKGIQERARGAAVQSDLSQAAKQLAVDKVLTGSYPGDTGSANDGKGLKASNGTVYQYTVNNSSNPSSFCLSGVNGNQAYHITNAGAPETGVCDGHTGPGGGGGSIACDTGFVPVPGNSKFGTNDFCVAKYEAKNVGGKAVSQAAGTPWINVNANTAISTASAACSGCHLVTEAEWLTIAHNLAGVASNWTSTTVGSGSLYTGHVVDPAVGGMELAASSDDNDGLYGMTGLGSPPNNNNRRTMKLSNGEVIWDFSGNVWEWTKSGYASTSVMPGPAGYDYQWREWSAVEGTGQDLVPSPFPSFGTPAAIGWTGNANGIGKVSSAGAPSGGQNFLRGGSWIDGTNSNAGIFSANMSFTDSYAQENFGFRVAK